MFDSPQTEAVVKKWVGFYKAHRAILDSDVVHVRRPDGRDLDGLLHVNPALAEKGLAMIYNPLDSAVQRTITLPLYYTGLSEWANIRTNDGPPRRFRLDRKYNVEVPLKVPARGLVWLTVTAGSE